MFAGIVFLLIIKNSQKPQKLSATRYSFNILCARITLCSIADQYICHILHSIFHQSIDWVLTENHILKAPLLYIFLLFWRVLIDALDIPVIGGLAELRYLTMDKLKTRGALLANKNVSIAEGIVYNKGNLSVCLLMVLPCINNQLTYVKDHLKYRSTF